MPSGLRQKVAAVLFEPPLLGLIERLPALHRRVPLGRRTHPFDREHGTNTSGVTPMPTQEEVGGTARYPYHGSQPSLVRQVLASLPDLELYSFVDLGSGKGRVLLIAAEFPFKHVLGVEIEMSLARVSVRNADLMAARYPQRTPIEVDVADAFAYELRPEMADRTVYFLYNPFGPEAIRTFVQHLEKRLAGSDCHIFVVYYNPLHGEVLDGSDRFSRWSAQQVEHADDEVGFVPPLTSEAIAVWQSEPARYPPQESAPARIVPAPGQFHVVITP